MKGELEILKENDATEEQIEEFKELRKNVPREHLGPFKIALGINLRREGVEGTLDLMRESW